MLPKPHRLGRLLALVSRRGQPLLRCEAFLAVAMPNRQPYFRAGVVASKRCAKTAPTRNRLRRRLEEALRTAIATTEAPPSALCLLRARRAAQHLPFGQLVEQCQQLLKKLAAGLGDSARFEENAPKTGEKP